MRDLKDRIQAATAGSTPSAFDALADSMPVLKGKRHKFMDIKLDLCDAWTSPQGSPQPFRMYSAEDMEEMVQDIAYRGLDQPILVRPMGGRYQILSGHNRAEACRRIGWQDIEAKVFYDLTDDEAEQVMLNTNLNQRRNLRPSELAAAYRMRLESIRRQGKRTDLTSGQSVQKLTSVEVVASEVGKNYKTVQRYIRLTYLTSYLLAQVDLGRIQFLAGVAISDIDTNHQQYIEALMRGGQLQHISSSQGDELKHFRDQLDSTMIRRILGLNRQEQVTERSNSASFKVVLPSLPRGVKKKDLCNDPVLTEKLSLVIQEYIENLH